MRSVIILTAATGASFFTAMPFGPENYAASAQLPLLMPFTITSVPSPFPDVNRGACRKDKDVQRFLASMLMSFGLAGGLLGMMTTSAWSSLSDRVGRCRIIAAFALGQVVQTGCLVLVSRHSQLLKPWIVHLLFASHVIFGLFGGFGVISAITSAYVTDSSSIDNYSTLFSIQNGIMTCGAVLGPLIGTGLIGNTGNLCVVSSPTRALTLQTITSRDSNNRIYGLVAAGGIYRSGVLISRS
jgi:hypothetical protein